MTGPLGETGNNPRMLLGRRSGQTNQFCIPQIGILEVSNRFRALSFASARRSASFDSSTSLFRSIGSIMSAAVFPAPQRRAGVTMMDVFKKLQSPNAEAHRYPAPDRNLRGWTESKLPWKFGLCPRIYNHFLAQEPSVDMLQQALSLERHATLLKIVEQPNLSPPWSRSPGNNLSRQPLDDCTSAISHLRFSCDATTERDSALRNRSQFGPRNGKVRAATIQAHQELGK